MWQWLRRSFIAGLFVTVPLVVSVVAIVWVFRFADRLTAGLGERLIGVEVPGLGLLTTALIVLATGALATNMIGKRFVDRTETLLMHLPLFKTIYAPVRQLMSAFSPDNEFGFKRMVLVEDTSRGLLLGFLTKEFTIDRGRGPETLIAVYLPTNHLYLGNVIVCPIERAVFPEMTVEEGIGVFLTGGVGLPDHVRADKTL
jgi:uncharacterized membrane protein